MIRIGMIRSDVKFVMIGAHICEEWIKSDEIIQIRYDFMISNQIRYNLIKYDKIGQIRYDHIRYD